VFRGFPGASVPAATAADVENQATGAVSVLPSAAAVAHTADEATAQTLNLNLFFPSMRPRFSKWQWQPPFLANGDPKP